MLPDYEAHEMLDYEAIAEELRDELFKTNTRLMHAEGLLRKIRGRMTGTDPGYWAFFIINEIDTLLGE